MGRATIFISGIVSQMPRYREVATARGKRMVMSFSVPADHGWGERKSTTFLDCEYWLPDSEKASNYIAHAMGKGARVAVVGEPFLDRWTARDGAERAGVKVDVASLDILQPAKGEDVQEAPGPEPAASGDDGLYDESIPF